MAGAVLAIVAGSAVADGRLPGSSEKECTIRVGGWEWQPGVGRGSGEGLASPARDPGLRGLSTGREQG